MWKQEYIPFLSFSLSGSATATVMGAMRTMTLLEDQNFLATSAGDLSRVIRYLIFQNIKAALLSVQVKYLVLLDI